MVLRHALVLILIFAWEHQGLAAGNWGDTVTATARQTVVQKIEIRRISDLNFGEAVPGEGPKTISPGTSENAENASFQVHGEGSRLFQIILPTSGSVTMVTGSGGQDREIKIQSFDSYPQQSGLLDSTGRAIVYVGAKRDALSTTQKPGVYEGQFTVTVVY